MKILIKKRRKCIVNKKRQETFQSQPVSLSSLNKSFVGDSQRPELAAAVTSAR